MGDVANNYSDKGVSTPGFAATLFRGRNKERKSIAFWDDLFDLCGWKFPHQLTRDDQERLATVIGDLVSAAYKAGHQDAKRELRDWLEVEERV